MDVIDEVKGMIISQIAYIVEKLDTLEVRTKKRSSSIKKIYKTVEEVRYFSWFCC